MNEMLSGERLDEVNDSISLLQKKNGMTFGTDALLLAAYVKPIPKGRAAELGAGCGIVSLLCAARGKFAFLDCVEIQAEYADLCRRNIALNGLKENLSVLEADIRSLRPDTKTGKEYDAILANPPYFSEKSGFPSSDSGRHAARHEVFGGIDDFCAAAAVLLRFGGTFTVVYRPNRLTDLLSSLRLHKLEPKRLTFVCETPDSPPCMMLLEAKKGGGSELFCTPNLYLSNSDKTPSDDRQFILQSGAFPSRFSRRKGKKDE